MRDSKRALQTSQSCGIHPMRTCETVAQPVLVCRCLGATNVAAEWRFWGVLSRVLSFWHDAFTERHVQVVCG